MGPAPECRALQLPAAADHGGGDGGVVLLRAADLVQVRLINSWLFSVFEQGDRSRAGGLCNKAGPCATHQLHALRYPRIHLSSGTSAPSAA